MQRLSAMLALLVAVPIVAAQSTSSSTGIASPGQGMSSQSSSQSGSSSQNRNTADDISAIAPPFDVDDVLRMHRVGLQDEVIINALRARYHPLKLSDSDRTLLIKNSVSAAVIAAMENPLGEDTVGHAAPPTVPPPPESDPAKAPAKPVSDAKHAHPDATMDATAVQPARTSPDAASSTTAAVVNDSLRLPILPHETLDSTETDWLSDANTPKTQGVYRRINGAGWGTVTAETVAWKHNGENPVKRAEGHLPGATSSTKIISTNSDFLIVTPEGVSVVQYQLVRIRSKHTGREFHPAPGGDAFGGGGNSEVVAYNPQKLGSTVWLVSLHNLPSGDYGFLPPVRGQLHSTTGFAKAIYTFHVL